MIPPIPVIRLRSATETVVPTTCSMIAVSAVIRLLISFGLFSSKKLGGIRSRLVWTSRRMSATTRSPSHETKKNRSAVAPPSTATIISRYWNECAIESRLAPGPKASSMITLNRAGIASVAAEVVSKANSATASCLG